MRQLNLLSVEIVILTITCLRTRSEQKMMNMLADLAKISNDPVSVVTAKHCVIGMVGGEGFYGAANLDEGEKFSFKTDSVTHHPMQYVDVALIQV